MLAARLLGVSDYLKLAWLVSSLAMIGGALGAAVEDETGVREAAYGYRNDWRPVNSAGLPCGYP